jgi:branched-subunit amino acid transport protein
MIGDRPLPPLVLRLLRYTPVAVIPGLVAPQVLWPAATGGQPDPARMLAAIATLAVGWWTHSFFAAMVAGAATLFAGLLLF